MDAYNEFSTLGEFMEHPVASWFVNGDNDGDGGENGGPDASLGCILVPLDGGFCGLWVN